ncbi:hypothetical protein BpHYR1_039765 [Brachionus plicatilis]|uniref:Uncharacterized protein n=1 Tax=Brachionus plicatilis TaxID=10195 RepID=A0A3M7SL74_BRAPC|nr:hypothetical protein BpHYR1_039765 [Brachionus plicatilis]
MSRKIKTNEFAVKLDKCLFVFTRELFFSLEPLQLMILLKTHISHWQTKYLNKKIKCTLDSFAYKKEIARSQRKKKAFNYQLSILKYANDTIRFFMTLNCIDIFLF